MATILIVDDEPEIRENLLECFQLEKFETHSAANGFNAIEVLENKNIDAVIIDLFMPEKDGLETIMELRQRWPEVKIVAMSGGPARPAHSELGNDLLFAATEIGANASLQKPFSLADAVAVVKNLLAA